MIIVMHRDCSEEEKKRVTECINQYGINPHWVPGKNTAVLELKKPAEKNLTESLAAIKGVKRIINTKEKYKLAGRDYKKQDSEVQVGDRVIGGNNLAIMAGPCAVESEEQLLMAAQTVKDSGGSILRAGIFKPRTSPYAFQGIGMKGLKIIEKVKRKTGLPVVTEVIDNETLEAAYDYIDVIQIGARSMQNYSLLTAVGKSRKPVLLKRGMSATIEEWLLAAEYVLSQGNMNVILCERGMRTYEKTTRNTLDLSAVPVIKELSHLPVIVDPSHAAGKSSLVSPLVYASAAAGADGFIIEMHPEPENAKCDGAQSLNPEAFRIMTERLKPIIHALGKEIYSYPKPKRVSANMG